jgi:hypothetical protein
VNRAYPASLHLDVDSFVCFYRFLVVLPLDHLHPADLLVETDVLQEIDSEQIEVRIVSFDHFVHDFFLLFVFLFQPIKRPPQLPVEFVAALFPIHL